MARLIAKATGNFTSSTTWGVADGTMVIDSEAGTLAITTSTTTNTSPNRTPGAITVDGVAVKISARGSSGTFTVVLRNTTSSIDVTSVTVNVADLPAGASGLSTGWCFFKFGASVTLLAATNYAIRCTCSVASGVTLFRSTASAQEFSRLLRTTTNAAPAAGDQMIITKEYTGAGTSNSITVTMDNTASTTFGSTTYVDSVSVSGGGVLTWGASASTNYQLKVAGLVSVWAGSTWNQGTSGTRIPSTSTAKLIFSVSVNVNSGFKAIGTATVNRYGNIVSATSTLLTSSIGGYCTSSGTAVTGVTGQSFVGLTGTIVINGSSFTISSVTDATHLTLTGSVTNSSPVKWTHAGTANVLKVASTSGWATGDVLGIASTSKTNTDAESATILTVDSSTQVTLTAALANQHSGDSPTQAEVIHLTRNVTVEGTSNSLQAYVQYTATSVVNDSYCQFKNLGSATALKRGIEIQTSTGGSYTAIGCSMQDFASASSVGCNFSNATLNGISVTYCNYYNCISGILIAAQGSSTTSNFIVNNCIVMKSTTGYNISDSGLSFTFNTATSCNTGIAITSDSNASIGAFSDLTSHSNSSYCLQISGFESYTFSNLKLWRSDKLFPTNCFNVIFDNVTSFGNYFSANGPNLAPTSCDSIFFKNSTFAGDLVFNAGCGYANVNNNPTFYTYFENCTFGVASGVLTQHASIFGDFLISNEATYVILRNCILASSVDVYLSSFPDTASIVSQNHNQIAGSHKRWEKYGIATSDTVTYRTSSPAEKLTPSNSTYKFNSTKTMPVAVQSGQIVSATVYVYKSGSYNGNQPRLMVESNYSVGINTDTVLATASGGTGTWLTLTGTTSAATADGAMVFYVDCDGTAGTVTVDDWSIS